jgi:hypothetical protein
MSVEQVISEAMKLSADDQMKIAQRLWENLEGLGLASVEDREGLEIAILRDREIESGAVQPISFEAMIRSLRA